MQIISNIALISINETLIIQLISFLIFLYVINRIMFQPLKSTMEERESLVKGLAREIRDSRGNVDDLLNVLKDRENTAREEAEAMKAELEEEGHRKAAEIHEEFQKTVAVLKAETEADAAAQLDEARKHLAAESEALAVCVMEQVLNRRLAS